MEISLESRPRLRPGCRFSEAPGQEHVLLIPEGLMKLTGPGRKILELCDSRNTFSQVLAELQSIYPAAVPEQIQRDTAAYLDKLRERGANATSPSTPLHSQAR